MPPQHRVVVEVSGDLLTAVRSFPVRREVEHCGGRIIVSPFDFYADCPHCGQRIKIRSFSACSEIEDLFDAFFEWMNQPGADDVATRRQEKLSEEE
jgi:hypothetical protein